MAYKKLEIQVFGSLAELCEFGRGPATGGSEGKARASRLSSKDWTLTANFDEAVDLARKGWDTDRKAINAEVAAIVADAQANDWSGQGVSFRYDVCGGEVDIDRFLSGEPECMIEWEPVATRPAVRVVLGTCVSGSTETGPIVKRGAAVTALVEALAASGISLELWCEASTDPGPGRIETFYRVKEFGSPLDINAFMFASAHPSAFRRLVFAAWERAPWPVRQACRVQYHHGYGRVTSSIHDDEAIGKVDLKIPAMEPGSRDPILTDTAGWVRRTVEELRGKANS